MLTNILLCPYSGHSVQPTKTFDAENRFNAACFDGTMFSLNISVGPVRKKKSKQLEPPIKAAWAHGRGTFIEQLAV